MKAKADFSGWATKADILCKDGRTIDAGAFRHQDNAIVPLVWQHGHGDPKNVLGHVELEHRPQGVYCRGYFNNTPAALHAKEALEHRDINMLSIYANELMERMVSGSKRVLHGVIKEVSLVLSGANPGARIEEIAVRHGDYDEVIEDEAIITLGLELMHGDFDPDSEENEDDDDEDDSDTNTDNNDSEEDEDMYDDDDDLEHADDDETIEDVIGTMNKKQKDVLYFLIGQAASGGDDMEQSDLDDNDDADSADKKGSLMHTNVFEKDKKSNKDRSEHVLSHDDMTGLLAAAKKSGSLKSVVEDYALQHNITDIDLLFPEVQAINNTPEFRKRRTEWVDVVMSGVRTSPFSRIKSIVADLTLEDARAKGYVKGTLKKEEFFNITRRETTPTTVYKKQALDRDDVVDITDFDVVAWLKGEMRLMLDEEIARAILIGDGRDIASDDKINEQNIRPIASDHELYTTTVNVNILDGGSNFAEVIDAIILNRRFLRGSGLPTLFTTETYIARALLLKDTTGRRIYKDLAELAVQLRVDKIVPVEVMEEQDEVICILVNLNDYNVGTTRGGEVSLFDDFDIDYNQQKYLIETRMSGALVKIKSALVVRGVAAGVTLVTPNAPTFDAETGVITIVATTGVVYKDVDDNVLSTGAQAAIDPGETFAVYAYPSSGSYALNNDEEDVWNFTRID